jgi:hypothetical protein
MKSSLRRVCSVFPLLCGVAGLLAGCQGVLAPKQRVLVDSIVAPGVAKPTGVSYRLVAKRAMVAGGQANIGVMVACVDAALAGVGLFEAPRGAAPDLFIEVGYGRDSAAQIDPAARETYLEFSGRSNPEHSPEKATGPELWNVRAAVLGMRGPTENALPLLSSVAVSYIATDTHNETKIEIPANSPVVESIRQAALKTLAAGNAAANAARAGSAAANGAASAPAPTPAPTR